MFFKKRDKDEDDEEAGPVEVDKPAKLSKAEKAAKAAAQKALKLEAKKVAKAAKELKTQEKAEDKKEAKEEKGARKGKKEKKVLTGRPGTVAKPKPIKFLKGTRFVLFIGDEGTILLYIKNNKVLSRQFVPDASEQNLEELRTSLSADMKAPLAVVIDSLDQTYVQQSLPPVSSMSVRKLMKRRLERDFGPNDIKGAILLGRESAGRKDWNFMMVSIEKNRYINMWLDFVYTLPNRFLGIYVVPVETEILVKSLDQAMGVPKGGTGSRWKFFVSHNKVGGFRQVILRDGRIIFTRMAQPIGESTPEVIAGNIEQEMLSTIEYMKRLSFDPNSGLDVYIISGSAIKPVIDKNKFRVANFNVMTPFETAQYLGIEGATQPTDQFGDVILAASISSSTKHILTLSTPESKKFEQFFSTLRFVRIGGVIAILGALGYAGSIASDIYDLYQASDELETSQRQHQIKLDQLKDEIKKSNLDLDKTGDLLQSYQTLVQKRVSPLDFINKVETVLMAPTVVKSIDWQVDDKAASGPAPAKSKTTVTFSLELPQIQSIEAWRPFSKKIIADLRAVFKGYDVKFTKIPNKYSETEKMDMTFDGAPVKASNASETNEVQLQLKEP